MSVSVSVSASATVPATSLARSLFPDPKELLDLIICDYVRESSTAQDGRYM